MSELARAQAQLIAALTGTGPVPDGFDPHRVGIARQALLRKRSAEAAKQWPALAATLDDRFAGEFTSWATHRPTTGSWGDGWNFALDLQARSQLTGPARFELARRRVRWRAPGPQGRRRRVLLAAAIVDRALVLQVVGRVVVVGRRS